MGGMEWGVWDSADSDAGLWEELPGEWRVKAGWAWVLGAAVELGRQQHLH